MWIILIIFLMILSIIIGFKTNFKCYKVNIKSLLLNDKSSLFLSLATKIGVGSIIGVVSSIIIGGYSSVIWMIIFSCIMIPLIYSESILGYKYKQNNIGGPYFILKKGLNNRFVSILSLIIIIVLYSFLFQMIQVNTISNLLYYTLNINKSCILLFILILILILIKLKSKEVTNIINKLVPFKCILFILVCLFGIVTNINELLLSFKIIIKDLFSLKSILSGFIIGIKRSIFMNEVMIGTTSIASGSSVVNIKEETNYQIIGVYFISIVITLLVTFLMIIYNYKNSFDTDYNLLIVNMFRYTNGYYGQLLIVIVLIIFALTTILSGYYILESNITYFIKNKRIISFIKLIFLSLIASSVYLNNTFIWKYTDIVIFIMIIINSYSIIRLIGDVINDRK